jgi:hypothetical protein
MRAALPGQRLGFTSSALNVALRARHPEHLVQCRLELGGRRNMSHSGVERGRVSQPIPTKPKLR